MGSSSSRPTRYDRSGPRLLGTEEKYEKLDDQKRDSEKQVAETKEQAVNKPKIGRQVVEVEEKVVTRKYTRHERLRQKMNRVHVGEDGTLWYY